MDDKIRPMLPASLYRILQIGTITLLPAALQIAMAQEVPTGPSAGTGAQIATAGASGAAACASCHGPRGEGMAGFPRLSGSGAGYLQRQLDAFADGSRQNPIMQPIAQALSPEQRAQVAAYYASLPGPASATERQTPAVTDTGAWLAMRGRWEDGLPACGQCHGPGGVGVGTDFPPLAGLSAQYIATQLKAWQAGTRPPGPLGLMEIVARKLDEADIQAVSTYYAGLAALAATAAGVPGSKP